jgi:hypothetical protein
MGSKESQEDYSKVNSTTFPIYPRHTRGLISLCLYEENKVRD